MVAACMLAGATPVLTGCIDNDEPAGIEQLRVAKSELLRAQALVEAAKVDQMAAQNALIEAQAAYQEALAKTEEANARIQEAIADQEEAKVALINTENEQKKQELEAAIAALEHQKEMWEIEKQNALTAAEQAIKDWELSYKQAEVAYEKALAELASLKGAVASQQLAVLQDYIADVQDKKVAMKDAEEDIRRAQRGVQKAAAAVEESEADKEYWQYDLARSLKLEQYKLEGIEAALAKANEELTEFQNMEPTAIAQKLDEVEAELAELNRQIADESLKKFEAEQAINAEYDAQVNALNEEKNQEIEIPAFTFPEVTADALPFAWKDVSQLEFDVTSYTWNSQYAYDVRLSDLNYLLDMMKAKCLRDENDNAWTQQSIAEWKADIEAANAAIEEQKNSWQQAVDAYYRVPADAVIDLSKIDGYTELAAAIEPFNAAVTAYQEAWEAFNAARVNLQPVRNEAYFNEVELGKKYRDEYYKLDEKVQDERDRLWAAYEALANDPEADPEAEQEALEAYNEFDDWAYFNELDAELIATRDEAIAAERAKVTAAVNEIKTTLATYQTARTDLDAQYEIINPLYGTFRANASTVNKWGSEVSALLNSLDYYNMAGMFYENYSQYSYWIDGWIDENGVYQMGEYIYCTPFVSTYTVDAADVTAVSRQSMRKLIAYKSRALFGEMYGTGFNDYGDPDARLLDLTFEDVEAWIDANYEEPLYGDEYIQVCQGSFGLMGSVMALEARVKFAEAWLADENSSVNKIIDALTAAIDAMETEYETLEADFEAKDEALRLAGLEKDKKIAEAGAACEELQAKVEPLQGLQEQIVSTITQYEENGFDVYSQDCIDFIVKRLEKHIKGLELAIEDQKHAIETAQRLLDGYNAGQITELEAAQEWLDDCIAAYQRAESDYQDALDLLNAIIKQMAVEDGDATVETPETPAE